MGVPEELLAPPGRRQRRLTAAADFVIAFFVATLLTTCAWKGLWILLDAAIFPGDPRPSAWTSFVVGCVSVYFQTFCRDQLQLSLFGGSASRAHRLAARGVIVVLYVGTVMLWRGIFLLMDTESGTSWKSYGLFAAAGLAVLIKLRFLATCIALPLSVSVDLSKAFFTHESPLDVTLADDYHLRSMDAFLAVVITCVTTFLWRGCWGVMDKLVLPEAPVTSLAVSLGIGLCLTAGCYVAQFWLASWLRSLSLLPGLVARDALVLVAFVGIVNVWRGVFLFFDTVLTLDLPARLRLGTAAGVVAVSVLLLMLLRLGKNLLLCGVQRDMVGPLPFNCSFVDQLCGAGADRAEEAGADVCAHPEKF